MRRVDVALLGAGGFLGRHAARALQNVSRRLRVHMSPEQFDIADETALCAFMNGADVVVHLAGPPSVAQSFGQSAEYVRAHAGGTAAVLSAMRATRVRRIVYISSAEVYGTPAEQPVEEVAPFMPRSPYGAAKAAAELLIQAAYREGDVDGFILRPFSVYGPGMSGDSLIGTVLHQAETSSDVFVNDVRPVRDYVYAGDVARAIALCSVEDRRGLETLNLCSGTATSIASIVETLARVLRRPLQLRERENARRVSDILRLIGDPRRAAVALDWRATTRLDEGIAALTADITTVA